MPTLLIAQNSDLSESDHTTKFEGDSTVMAPLLESLRSDYKGIIVPIKDLCHEVVTEVGKISIKGKWHYLVYQKSAIGQSCKGITNLLVFKEDMIIGFYRSDLMFSFRLEGSTLLAKSEARGSTTNTVDLSKGLPKSLPFASGLRFNEASKYERN